MDNWDIQTRHTTKTNRPTTKTNHPTLQSLLDWGLSEEKKCIQILKALPPQAEEYSQLVGKLDKLQYTNRQIRQQLVFQDF